MNDSTNTSAWEWVGKSGTVLAVIIASITVWNHLFPHTEKIRAYAHYHSYALPPDLASALEKLRDSEDWSKIRNPGFVRFEGVDDDSIENVEALGESVERLWALVAEIEFVSRIQKYRGFVYLTAQNTGTKEAENLVLDLPIAGVALRTSQDDSQTVIEFEKKLLLGNLRPNTSVSVAIWAEERISQYHEDDFFITYSNGFVQPRFGRTVSGLALLVDAWAPLIALIIVLIVVSLVLPVALARRQPAQTEREDENET